MAELKFGTNLIECFYTHFFAGSSVSEVIGRIRVLLRNRELYYEAK